MTNIYTKHEQNCDSDRLEVTGATKWAMVWELKMQFAAAASCRGIEVTWFVSNPVDELRYFWMFSQSLYRRVILCQFDFCEQSVNLLVTRSVHENGDDTTAWFGGQMMRVSQTWRNGSVTEFADSLLCNPKCLRLRASCRLQPFDTTLSHYPCFYNYRISMNHVNQNYGGKNNVSQRQKNRKAV